MKHAIKFFSVNKKNLSPIFNWVLSRFNINGVLFAEHNEFPFLQWADNDRLTFCYILFAYVLLYVIVVRSLLT